MASFLVLATFTLEGIDKVPPPRRDAVQRRIAADLAKLGLRPVLYSKKRHARIDLPGNFYAGEFEKGEPFHTATELREHLARKVRKTVCKAHPAATIFLAVSRRWTWRRSLKKGRLVEGAKPRRRAATGRPRRGSNEPAYRRSNRTVTIKG